LEESQYSGLAGREVAYHRLERMGGNMEHDTEFILERFVYMAADTMFCI